MHKTDYPSLVAAIDSRSKRGRSQSRSSDLPSKRRQMSMEEALKLREKFTQKKGREVWTR